jgi:hypothetical protein
VARSRWFGPLGVFSMLNTRVLLAWVACLLASLIALASSYGEITGLHPENNHQLGRAIGFGLRAMLVCAWVIWLVWLFYRREQRLLWCSYLGVGSAVFLGMFRLLYVENFWVMIFLQRH